MITRICQICGRREDLDISAASLAALYQHMPYVCDECIEKHQGRKREWRERAKAKREAARLN